MVDTGDNGTLSVEIGDGGTLVVHGDIDIAGGPILEHAIREQEQKGPVVIDLSDVSFVDSSGLRSLLNASRRAGDQSAHVTLRGVGPMVARLLDITGTTDRFAIEDPGE